MSTETRYLVQLNPPRAYADVVGAFIEKHRDSFSKVNQFYAHCTLFTFNALLEHEKHIVSELTSVSREPFYIDMNAVVLANMDIFGEQLGEASLAVRFEKNGLLKLLHMEIANAVRKYISSPLGELPLEYAQDPDRIHAHALFGSPYFGMFYSPHTTLGSIHPGEEIRNGINLEYLAGLGWKVDSFSLSRKNKVKGVTQWDEIQKFSLRNS